MGTLRLIFTITIILGHIYAIFGFRMHELLSSPIAFESFFLLSGFYIAMVWQTGYSDLTNGYKKFLTKRILRIFPLYWLVLLVTVVISLITYVTLGNPLLLDVAFSNWNKIDWTVKLYVLFSNIFIFGQEAIFFVKINYETGNFAWSQKFIDGNPPLHFFLLVSQAWAISYILYFYLLLPFLHRFRSVFIFILLVILLTLRFAWYQMGHQYEPWLYRFFPFEFAFFLAGMLSSRFYLKYSDKLKTYRSLGISFFIVFFIATCCYDLWHVDYLSKQWLYYAMLCILMPLFFSLFKDNAADNYLGQLAYPAYMCNFIVIHLIKLAGVTSPVALIFSVIGITLLISVILVQFVINPLDNFALTKIGVLKRQV